MLTITAALPNRDKKRDRERRARQRRTVKLQQMRHQRDALECAVVVSHTIHDVDGVWEDFLDNQALFVRHFLRQSLRLTREAQALQHERTLLMRLLEEHRLSSRSLAEMLKELPAKWELNIARWRRFSRMYFKPWTRDDCKVEMEAALKELSAFDWSLEKETTGLSFMGWREQRRMDKTRGIFQYQFTKTYHSSDMMDYVNVGWDTYTDSKTFRETISYGVPFFHEVLQQLGPIAMIIWGVQRLPHVNVNAHMTVLICRVQTERGVLQCVRSIACSELIKVVDGPDDMWASNFAWKEWTRLDDEENGYKYRVGGSIAGKDSTYLHHWMIGVFASILRSERLATGKQLLRGE